MYYTLFTYRSIEDFKYLDEKYDLKMVSVNELNNLDNDFFGFDFIDITMFIHFVSFENRYSSFILGLKNYLDNGGKVIIRENFVSLAMDYGYYLFDKFVRLDVLDNLDSSSNQYIRKIAYTYSYDEFDSLINFFNKNDISFNNLNVMFIQNGLNKLCLNVDEELIIDISEVVENKNDIFRNYFITLFLEYSNFSFIIRDDLIDKDYLNNFFEEYVPISEKFSDFSKNNYSNKYKFIELDEDSKNKFKMSFDNKLIGHSDFKKDLFKKLDDFCYLNYLGFNKIFSIFLLGDSGLGKTEVARLLSKNINKDENLIKINFGNYSSNDSLNSLIGSPRGYIGSQEGELSIKLNNSNVGVILCDEFEKANSKIFSFFLELLEEGKFTDSQSIEYNLDGYIIIFTSNISDNDFRRIIPNEFISRLNMIYTFVPLNLDEKKQFVNFQIKSFKNKLINVKNPNYKKFDEKCLDNFTFDFDLNSTDNLRVIKRELYNQIIEYLF